MNKFFNKKTLGILMIALLLVIIPRLSLAEGNPITCALSPLKCAVEIFEWATETIGYIMAYITAQLISLAAYFIQVLIGMSIRIMETPVVQEGFKISLSFANLGFTLAVIFIAFITIFRLQGYETKKLLRNLIVAAVLINFSFTFAGLIMDGSHIFAKFFLNAIAGDRGDLGNLTASIADSLNIQKIHNAPIPAGNIAAAANVGVAYYKMLASIALTVFFNSIMVITFFTIAGLMVVRYIVISILLVIMPFAWLCWIFPNLASNWKKWWETFLKWNIFLPVLMFFIYLSVLVSSKTGEFITASGGISTGNAAASFTTFSTEVITSVVQALVQVALLFGGMIIAQKMGLAGSDAIMKGSNKVKGWVTGGVTGLATGKYAYQAGKYGVGKVAPGFAPVKGGAQWAANLINNKLRFIPGAAGAVVALNKFASRKGDVEAYQKSYLNDLTDDQLKQVAIKGSRDNDQLAAILAETIKRKKVGFLTEGLTGDAKKEQLKMYAAGAKATQNEGLQKEVANMAPSLAHELMVKPEATEEESVRKIMEKMPAAKIAELDPEELARVSQYLGPKAFAKIYEAGTEEQLNALNKKYGSEIGEDDIGNAIRRTSHNIEEVAESLKEATKAIKDAGTKEEKQAAQTRMSGIKRVLADAHAERKEALKKASTTQRTAFAQLQYMSQIIGGKEKVKESDATRNPFKGKADASPVDNKKAP